MTIRWGRRSTGGIVRRGHGGWYLHLGFSCWLQYVNPDTGDAASVVGWRLLRNYRRARDMAALQREKREVRRADMG